MKPAVGLIGLGLMGHPMGANLLKAGHELTVWNRTASRGDDLVAQGAKRAATPRELAAASEVVITIVSDPPALRQVSRVAIPRTGIQRLEVPRLNSPSRIDRAVKGAAWGLGVYVVAATIGIVHEKATCNGPDCFGEGMAWIGLIGGIPFAAGVGAGIGFALPVRRWQHVPVR